MGGGCVTALGPDDPVPASAWRRALGLILVAVVVSIAFVVLWAVGQALAFDMDLSPAALGERLKAWGRWVLPAALGLVIAYSLLPLPATAIAVANGMLFGPWLGTGVTWLGAVIAAILAFVIARLAGKPAIERFVPQRYDAAFQHWTRAVGAGELLIVRLVPVISFTLINYAAGLSGIRLWPFVWTTAVGILPFTAASVLIGHGAIAWSPGLWLMAVTGLVAVILVTRRLAARLATHKATATDQ